MQKSRQTVIFTLHFKMPTAKAWELLAPKFQLAQSGVRFGKSVFGWTSQKFPFNVKTAHTLKIHEPHVITVIGKAFYDIGHASADHSNRRTTPKDYAVWEIHPVMKMDVRVCSRSAALVSFSFCRYSRARGALPRPLGGFHLSLRYTEMAKGSSPHNVLATLL
jgi:hypothetical protein